MGLLTTNSSQCPFKPQRVEKHNQMNLVVIILIGLIQGITFGVASVVWPDHTHDAFWLYGLVIFTAIAGSVLNFTWDGSKGKSLIIIAGMTGLIFALLACWVAWMLPGSDDRFSGDDTRLFTFVTASIMAVYVLLPYLQIFHEKGRWELDYQLLFNKSWNNIAISIITVAFVALFWILISLWAALFGLIGIDFFRYLFFTTTFAVTTIPAVSALGIGLLREQDKIVNALKKVMLVVFRSLTLLLAAIILLFLFSLPFTGLQPLWDTNNSSTLLLTMLLVSLLFFNASYQDGDHRPYQQWLWRIVQGLILTMPVMAVLVFLSIGQRIDQYGLTPSRFYVVVIAAILLCYGISYSAAMALSKAGWMSLVRPANIFMSLLVVTVGILLHTPLLDPLSWSADSQYNRLVEEKVDAKAFDYGYLRFKLGREGDEKLKALAALKTHPQAEEIAHQTTVVNAASHYNRTRNIPNTTELTMGDVLNFTDRDELPPNLIRTINSTLEPHVKTRCLDSQKCAIFTLDLDSDDKEEWIFFSTTYRLKLVVFEENHSAEWAKAAVLTSDAPSFDIDQTLDAIKESRISLFTPQYKSVEINGMRYFHSQRQMPMQDITIDQVNHNE